MHLILTLKLKGQTLGEKTLKFSSAQREFPSLLRFVFLVAQFQRKISIFSNPMLSNLAFQLQVPPKTGTFYGVEIFFEKIENWLF